MQANLGTCNMQKCLSTLSVPLLPTPGLQETLSGLREQLKNINQEVELLGPPDSWYVDRLSNYLNQYGQVRQGLDGLQQRLATRQLEAEKVRS